MTMFPHIRSLDVTYIHRSQMFLERYHLGARQLLIQRSQVSNQNIKRYGYHEPDQILSFCKGNVSVLE
jgi:hypothetical protein